MAAGAQCLSPWANSVVVPQMPSWSSSSSTVFAQEEEGFSPPLSGRGGRVYDERRFFGSPSSSSTSSTSPGYTETETATFYDGSYQVVTNSPYHRRLQMVRVLARRLHV
ncbi:hypothetical protein L596_021773 [Steinernema carpocapsae]|uniref:Uncharacterized protein n=1 Tax=Steinernema carpocapsae TaxID=34508 RepID=A0A4V6A075_STECR|nr:hypothetical protein L596_021773 [Steinernema carpocapsae]